EYQQGGEADLAQHGKPRQILEIGGLGGFESALGAHDQFAELAGRAFAAAGLGHAVGMLADEGIGAGHGHAQADPANDRQVRQVVAQVGDFGVVEAQLGKQLVQYDQLVFAALVKVLDAEVLRTSFDDGRLAPADDRRAYARVDQHLDAMPIQRVEGLELAAVGKEVKPAVGEYAIDIEYRQADIAGALQKLVHHITPARSRSCMFKAPTGRFCSSMTTNALILLSSMIFRASAASMSAVAVLPRAVITWSIWAWRTSMPLSRVRRRSPSVETPARPPSSSSTTVMPSPFWVISSSASRSEVPRLTCGSCAPLCMTCSTFSSRRRPSAPPGWEKAKSSAVKPRASSSAMANASPSTRLAVVDDVGARLSGQASAATLASRLTAAALASTEAGLPVMLIRVMPRRLISGSNVTISLVVPELESASTTSSRVIMPMSPWLASAGCTKNAAVPVLASVAAILLPMWPDLPMPTTTTRPLQARISSQARTKCSSMRDRSRSTASISRPMVRCEASINWLLWVMSARSSD